MWKLLLAAGGAYALWTWGKSRPPVPGLSPAATAQVKSQAATMVAALRESAVAMRAVDPGGALTLETQAETLARINDL